MELKTDKPLLKLDPAEKKMVKSLSAAHFVGEHLFITSDELNSNKKNSIERLSTSDGQTFASHKSFTLDKLLTLPAAGTDADQEIDIEGLDFRDEHFWLLGSHSLKRKKVEPDDEGTDADLIDRLSEVKRKGNRFILARIPVAREQGGEPGIPAPPADGQNSPAQQLRGDAQTNDLIDAIKASDGGAGDKHLAKFIDVPGKDNGLDIEGLAVAGEKQIVVDDRAVVGQQVFLGLRGPVLRGWAVILELSVATGDQARLTLNNIGPEGRPYRKHFLSLGGLGIRSLSVSGDDLLMLAGPSMNLDGPTYLYRWKGALQAEGETLVRGEKLERLKVDFPFEEGVDHAEGFSIIPDEGEPRRILVVYDSPAGGRLKGGPGTVTADVFDLPSA